MSAAAIPKPRHGVVKVPLSYFTRMLSEIDKASERDCFGLVLQLTIGLAARGRMKARTWAHIKPEQFAETSRVAREYVMDRVDAIRQAGWIEERCRDPKNQASKEMEYSISPKLTKETKGEELRGRCSECKVIGQFKTEFIAIPLEYFTVLTPGLKPAALLVTAVIARFSHERAWDAEHGLIPKWTELDLSQFERMTGLDRRQIENGIFEAEEKKVIKVIREKGKVNTYITLIENWTSLDRRALRIVRQPTPKPKTESTPRAPKTPANANEETKSSPITIGDGWCPVCCHITAIHPVSEEELAEELAKAEVEPISRPPRAGPQRETGRQSNFQHDLERRRKEALRAVGFE